MQDSKSSSQTQKPTNYSALKEPWFIVERLTGGPRPVTTPSQRKRPDAQTQKSSIPYHSPLVNRKLKQLQISPKPNYNPHIPHSKADTIRKIPLWRAPYFVQERSRLESKELKLFSSFTKSGEFDEEALLGGYQRYKPLHVQKSGISTGRKRKVSKSLSRDKNLRDEQQLKNNTAPKSPQSKIFTTEVRVSSQMEDSFYQRHSPKEEIQTSPPPLRQSPMIQRRYSWNRISPPMESFVANGSRPLSAVVLSRSKAIISHTNESTYSETRSRRPQSAATSVNISRTSTPRTMGFSRGATPRLTND